MDIKCSGNVISCNELERVKSLFEPFLNQYRKLPVIDSEKNLKGIVCSTDLLSYLGAGDRYREFVKENPLSVGIGKIMTERLYTVERSAENEDIALAFETGRGTFPVVQKGRLVGILSEHDIIRSAKFGLERVEAVMSNKPFSLKKNDTVFDAAKIMVNGRFRRLPVTEDGILIGIVSPSDILYRVYSKGTLLRKESTPVTHIMKRSVITTAPRATLKKVAGIIMERSVGGLPVVEDGELLGMITERDLVNFLLK